jgi:hypothetical protein
MMLSPELTDQVMALPAPDQMALMDVIARSLKAEPLLNESATSAAIEDYFVPGQTYEVWMPIEAPAAGQALLALISPVT